jgi:hypothetical protein
VKNTAKKPRRDLTDMFKPDDLTGIPTADTSNVIVDFGVLRQKAMEANPALAAQVLGFQGVQEKIKKAKGGRKVIEINPFDIHVNWNARSFNSEARKARVLWMAGDIGRNGIKTALDVYFEGEKLALVSGETRLRGLLHAIIFNAAGVQKDIAPNFAPVLLERPNTNDLERVLNAMDSNEVDKLNIVEIAEGYARAERIGGRKAISEIATRKGRSETHVTSTIALLSMPERVLDLVREGSAKAHFCWSIWNDTAHNAEETLAIIKDAIVASKEQGSTRAMRKHLAPGSAGTGKSRTAPVAAGGKEADDKEAGSDVVTTRTATTRADDRDKIITGMTKTIDVTAAALRPALYRLGDDGRVWIGVVAEDFLPMQKRLGLNPVEGLEEAEAEPAPVAAAA